MTDDEVESEARRLYPWCFEPGCFMEDEQRKRKGQSPRDWALTREFARQCVRAALTKR